MGVPLRALIIGSKLAKVESALTQFAAAWGNQNLGKQVTGYLREPLGRALFDERENLRAELMAINEEAKK